VRLMAQICDKEVVALMKHRLLTRGCIFLRLHTQRLHHEEQFLVVHCCSNLSISNLSKSANVHRIHRSQRGYPCEHLICCGHTARKRFLKPSQSGALSNQMVLARKVWLLLSQTYLWHAPAGTTTRNKLREVTATFLDDNNKSLESEYSYISELWMAYAVVAAFLLVGSSLPVRKIPSELYKCCFFSRHSSMVLFVQCVPLRRFTMRYVTAAVQRRQQCAHIVSGREVNWIVHQSDLSFTPFLNPLYICSLLSCSSYGKKCFLTQDEDCYDGQLTTGNKVRA
ncbi:hypothetical protein GCK32_010259, partial [Trichostrongylus colubriformis]